jgi:hypothetical protein
MPMKQQHSRYLRQLRRYEINLERFAGFERSASRDLVRCRQIQIRELSSKTQRMVDFLQNSIFTIKPGSLAALFEIHMILIRENPASTKKTIMDNTEARYERYFDALVERGDL